MAAHAIMAYKDINDNVYYAKFVYYGAYEDVRDAIINSNEEEFLRSILQGNSAKPFDGFYLDTMYSIEELNLTKKQFIEDAPNQIAKVLKSFSEVKAFAKHSDASYIYLWDLQLHVYELINSQWQDWFESINSIEPLNLGYAADRKMIVDELRKAYDEVNSFDFNVDDVLKEHQLDWLSINACKTKEEAIKACERFNAALPTIKKELKERML